MLTLILKLKWLRLLGHEYILHGTLNGQKMCAKVNSRLEPEAHSTIKLTMDLSKIHSFDMETENRIDYI